MSLPLGNGSLEPTDFVNSQLTQLCVIPHQNLHVYMEDFYLSYILPRVSLLILKYRICVFCPPLVIGEKEVTTRLLRHT